MKRHHRVTSPASRWPSRYGTGGSPARCGTGGGEKVVEINCILLYNNDWFMFDEINMQKLSILTVKMCIGCWFFYSRNMQFFLCLRVNYHNNEDFLF